MKKADRKDGKTRGMKDIVSSHLLQYNSWGHALQGSSHGVQLIHTALGSEFQYFLLWQSLRQMAEGQLDSRDGIWVEIFKAFKLRDCSYQQLGNFYIIYWNWRWWRSWFEKKIPNTFVWKFVLPLLHIIFMIVWAVWPFSQSHLLYTKHKKSHNTNSHFLI